MERDIKRHYSRIRFVLVLVLFLNWGVAAAKIVVGIMSECQSMIADGFHSLSDGASNVIGLVGIAISSKPVDRDHPYGHAKYETFFSLGIAALLFFLAMNLIRISFAKLASPVIPQTSAISFIVMIATMAINIGVVRYEYSKGRKLGSDILIADALHTKADILTSLSVIIALLFIRLGFPIADPIATFVISIFIGYAGFDIVKEASRVLCDTTVLDVNKISNVVLKVDGVKACHKIRTRGRPDDICVDLHVQVDPAMNMEEGHRICFAIEGAIKEKFKGISDVLVHIEPKKRSRKFLRK